jgi:hypothetical protein
MEVTRVTQSNNLPISPILRSMNTLLLTVIPWPHLLAVPIGKCILLWSHKLRVNATLLLLSETLTRCYEACCYLKHKRESQTVGEPFGRNYCTSIVLYL